MVRPPPTSTLFPYTTLFRSGIQRVPALAIGSNDVLQVVWYSEPGGSTSGVDRKSTRLNSSHVAISYAVFCLKKKKNQKISQSRSNDQPDQKINTLTVYRIND